MGDDKRGGVFDFLFGELSHAVQDIRSKLIDEGWFGRRAAPPSQFDANPLGWDRAPERETIWTDRSGSQRQSFEEAWAPRDPSEGPSPVESSDHDLDR